MQFLRTRLVTTTLRRGLSTKASSNYPGLYFHPLNDSTSYSLSFLSTPAPSLKFSPTTIGSLSSPKSSSGEGEAEPEILPRYFEENPQFLQLVHEVLKENCDKDLWLNSLAKAVGQEGNDTYIHISDQRNPSEAQRTPQPQDIIASVLVKSSSSTSEPEIVASTYSPNKAAYRLVSEMGLMKLTPGLFEKLVQACERVREVEIEVAKEEKEKGETQ